MVDRIKKYQESVFGDMPADQGPADKKFVTTSDTGIPMTEAQNIIAKNQKWATDLPMAPFQWLGNKLIPFAEPFGQKNPWLMTEEQKKIQQSREINSAAYVKRKENVKDQLATIFDMAQKKYEDTGDEKYHQMALQAKTDILAASGLTDADFLPVNADTYRLYDEFGLFTNEPNPYPMVEAGMYFAGGIKGFNYGWNGGLMKKFLKGAPREFVKGFVKGKGGWLGRVGSGLVHGAVAVGAADMGYEVILDAMNRAGKAKAYMSMPRAQRDQVVDDSISPWLDKALQGSVDPILEKLPDRLTFGSEGINRPELGSVEDLVPYRFNPWKAKPEGPPSRIANAVDAAVFDAAISAAFFGIRPVYMGFKKLGGWAGGLKTAPPGAGSKIYKGKDEATQELYEDFGVLTGPEILAADKA